jgi:hypothetical protein
MGVTADANPPPDAPPLAQPWLCHRRRPHHNPVGLRHDERRKKGTKGFMGQAGALGVARSLKRDSVAITV